MTAPMFAALLLLLPVIYVGSYLALVDPFCRRKVAPPSVYYCSGYIYESYRIPGSVCGQVFWPLEQIDQRLRPGTWDVYRGISRHRK